LPEDDFAKSKRMSTYEKNCKKILEVLDDLSGKTIIFIQAKYNSLKLENIISKKFKVVNFCTKENNEEEVSSEEFEKLKKEFSNYKEKCVGIININGRVEGHNFTDDDSIPQVSNVIIYGFPLPPANELIKAREKLYIDKFSNEQKILNHVYLNDPIQKIQQACYRCKRNDESNPIIILWGSRFSKNKDICLYPKDAAKTDWKYINREYNVFSSLPSDFKKNNGNYQELIKFIKKREDDRVNITH